MKLPEETAHCTSMEGVSTSVQGDKTATLQGFFLGGGGAVGNVEGRELALCGISIM